MWTLWFCKRCICVLLWFLVHFSCYLCIDIHLSEYLLPGAVVFNASLGEYWSYSIDTGQSTSTEILSVFMLDSNTGIVYLQRRVSCSQIETNCISFNIRSHSHQNHNHSSENVHIITVLPITFIFHGKECLSSYHRKHERRKIESDMKIYIYMKHNSTVHKDAGCIPKNVPIMNLFELIPNYLDVCKKRMHMDDTQKYKLDVKTGIISTNLKSCDYNTDFKDLSIPARCVISNSVELKIHIHVQDLEIYTSKKSQIFESIGNSHNHRFIRLKRQTSNQSPTFPQLHYYGSVREEQNPGIHVIRITATDSDSGDAGRLTYSMMALRDQRSKDMFAINPVSGDVNTTKRLDRELMEMHYFSVLAVDKGRDPQTAQAMLEITVEDINDQAPVFESNVSYKDVPEDTGIGSTVFTVKATDGDAGDNAKVNYFLVNSSPPNDVFVINPTEGSITTRATLDRENVSSYQLLIRATDQGQSNTRKSATATVNIRVLDKNDNFPQFSQKTYHVNVSEDFNYSQNPVIISVSATDADEGVNSNINYAIFGGNTFDTFTINRVTGAIAIQKPLDYEQTQKFHLSVRAQDGGQPPLMNSTTVVVDVIDINDNDPEFYSSPHIGTVLESAEINSTVLNVQASDADSGLNKEIVYSIVDAAADLPFFVNSIGEIKVKSRLDREKGGNYEFVVKAQDKGVPPRSATTQVRITIRDVNDNRPKFEKSFYNITVPEDTPISDRIISLTATDADAGDNAFITYSITRGNPNKVFKITTVSGEGLVSLVKQLDYKIQNTYMLTVKAVDPGNLNDTATVQINVLDTNQHSPTFQGTPYTMSVEENIGVGSSIYKVLAIDQDVGENARISYQILGSTHFHIDPNSGEISTRIELDRETQPSYNFEVTARDHGQPAKTATTFVTVRIYSYN